VATILLVDDEPNILKSVGGALQHEGYEVETATDVATARDALKRTFDAALLDVWLPDGSGIDLLAEVRAAHPECVVVMISGHAELSDAVSATRRGAFDFLEKPLSLEKLLLTLQNGLEMQVLRREQLRRRQSEEERYAILGTSRAITDLLGMIERVAESDVRVLIRGENGTGKELVARQLHMRSGRSNGSFVALNCAALPENLIESELFGFEKGAFTGASRAQEGKFEEAHRGTLLLDEVGDLPLAAQAKLLRVLEEGTVRRLGSKREQHVDVRIVAATNRDLEQMVRDRSFREDLLFRLNVVPIEVPALRDRSEDVGALAIHFLGQVGLHGRPRQIAPSALKLLSSYRFPGNVRELRNMMERAAILTDAQEISAAGLKRLFPELARDDSVVGSYSEQIDAAERDIVIRALTATGWNVSRSAELLGLERSHLYKKMRSLGLERPGEG